jgi:hypothetical protein
VTLLLFDCFKQPIEISEIAGIALHAGDIPADFFDCFVESSLAAACDKHVCAFLKTFHFDMLNSTIFVRSNYYVIRIILRIVIFN